MELWRGGGGGGGGGGGEKPFWVLLLYKKPVNNHAFLKLAVIDLKCLFLGFDVV